MRVTHLIESEHFCPDKYSGTPFWINKELRKSGLELHDLRLTTPQLLLPPLEELTFHLKKYWLRFVKRSHLVPNYSARRAQYLADMLKVRLANVKSDAFLATVSPQTIAYLETKTPIVYWTDFVYGALVNFYPHFRFHDTNTMWDGHFITEACLTNAKLLIFSSDWAARTAVELYGTSKHKIKVVPFGANLDITHSYEDVKTIIKNRSQKIIKLLFVGKDWYRKGGDITLRIAAALHEAGHPVELTLVGGSPDEKKPLPSYVKCENLISKRTFAGINKIKSLYQESHFLFLPTRADCCPIVFAEANAFGLPCITTYVGGIPTAIKDNINGMTFSLEAMIKEYCDYITCLMANRSEYEALALSSYNEYTTRLNWQVATQQVKKLMAEII